MINNISDFRQLIQDLVKDDKGGTLRQIKIEISEFMKDAVQIGGSVAVIKEELTCGICLEIVLQTCITRCKHVFCKFCVDMCLLQKRECPLCRSALSEPTHLKLNPKADRAIQTVMLNVNPEYDSWSRKEMIERDSRYNQSKEEQYNDSDGDMDGTGSDDSWNEFEDDTSFNEGVDGHAGDEDEASVEGDDFDSASYMSDSDIVFPFLLSSDGSSSDFDDLTGVVSHMGYRRSGFFF